MSDKALFSIFSRYLWAHCAGENFDVIRCRKRTYGKISRKFGGNICFKATLAFRKHSGYNELLIAVRVYTMPQLFVRVKQIGKRKPLIGNQPLAVPETVRTLAALLEYIVRQRVEAFNERGEEGNWTKYLTDFDLDTAAETGKVGFDAAYNDRKQDADKAVDTALLAFQDVLFRVFLDDDELETLDAELNLHDGNVLTFIRLTMLAGRSW